MLSFRHAEQTSKNVADTSFKELENQFFKLRNYGKFSKFGSYGKILRANILNFLNFRYIKKVSYF